VKAEDLTKQISEKAREAYHVYRVLLQFRDQLHGGIPRSPELIKGWLEARGMSDAAKRTEQELGDQLLEKEERAWNGFKSVNGSLVIEARQVEACLKECASVSGMTQRKEKRGLKQILQHGLFVAPPFIPLGKTLPDGCEERAVHAMTRQGPRTALKRTDYVDKPRIEFTIKVLPRILTDADLAELLALAQENGIGANRSQGAGKCDIVECERIA
jgi:hypothetical protein